MIVLRGTPELCSNCEISRFHGGWLFHSAQEGSEFCVMLQLLDSFLTHVLVGAAAGLVKAEETGDVRDTLSKLEGIEDAKSVVALLSA